MTLYDALCKYANSVEYNPPLYDFIVALQSSVIWNPVIYVMTNSAVSLYQHQT